MTQMEELFERCYKKGIYWEDFICALGAEAYRIWSINENGEFTQKAQGIYERCKRGEIKVSLSGVLKTLYTIKRVVPKNANGKVADANAWAEMLKALQDDSLMDLKDQRGSSMVPGKDVRDMGDSFLHRFPKNRFQKKEKFGNKTYGRFVVNAEMNPQLIKELDEFCTRHHCLYKTSYPSEWDRRVDPVNVYSKEKITEKLKKEFVSIMQKYVRRDRMDINKLLDGDVLLPGITCAKEYTAQEDIDFIFSLPKRFQRDAFAFAGGARDINDTRMSLGQRKTLEEFYKLYKQHEFRSRDNEKTVLMSIPVLKSEETIVKPLPLKAKQKSSLQERLASYGQKISKNITEKLKPLFARKQRDKKTTEWL